MRKPSPKIVLQAITPAVVWGIFHQVVGGCSTTTTMTTCMTSQANLLMQPNDLRHCPMPSNTNFTNQPIDTGPRKSFVPWCPLYKLFIPVPLYGFVIGHIVFLPNAKCDMTLFPWFEIFCPDWGSNPLSPIFPDWKKADWWATLHSSFFFDQDQTNHDSGWSMEEWRSPILQLYCLHRVTSTLRQRKGRAPLPSSTWSCGCVMPGRGGGGGGGPPVGGGGVPVTTTTTTTQTSRLA